MEVSKGPSVQIGQVAPSLVEFLETATTNDYKDDISKCEAFQVLENALEVLTSSESRIELLWEILNTMFELLPSRGGSRKSSEEAVNVAIVKLILMHLTSGIFVLNEGHLKFLERVYLPETFRWKGLALGHRNAWYGELDIIVCPLIKGEPQPKVGILFGGLCDPKKNVPDNWSLFGGRYSQGYATAVTFSYVYHYSLSGSQLARSSMLPTIQISPDGYQIFLYDCLQDIMLANNFYWNRETLIYLWAFLHHHLFFPASLDVNVANDLIKFGYDKSAGFYKNRSELLFGASKNSQHWKKAEPEEGRRMHR
ncbi:hypothetical protein ACROYT_G006699 [Oculina patagonica]